jgi:DNA polymerase III alpha subunit
MEELRETFLAGAASNGVSAHVAATVYEKILAFAEFGFRSRTPPRWPRLRTRSPG